MRPNDQRFFLGFEYEGPKGKNWGDQIVVAESLEKAAQILMRERSLDSIFITKRYWTGRPASEAVEINQYFSLK